MASHHRPGSSLRSPRVIRSLSTSRTGCRGWTLLEAIFSVLLIVGGGGALLLAISSALTHNEYLSQAQIAVNEAQGLLEELAAVNFDVLWTRPTVTLADGTVINLTNARADRDLIPFTGPILPSGQPTMPNGQLAVQIRPVPITTPPADPTAALLDLHVAVCWTNRGRTIGEQNGATACQDSGADADWAVDSPVMVSRRLGMTPP